MIDAVKDGVLNAVLHWRHGGTVETVRFVDLEAGTEAVVLVDRLPALRDDAFRVVCISDTHDAHRAFSIPPADVLVHAGDVQMTSRRFSDKDNARKVCDVNEWLRSLTHVHHKVVVGGNHDGYLESLGSVGAKAALSHAAYLVFEDAVLVHPRNPRLSMHVYGAPFSRGRSGNDAYQLRTMRDAVCKQHGRRIPPSMVPVHSDAEARKEKMGSSSAAVPLYDLAITHEPYYTHLVLGTKQREHRHQVGHVHIGGHLHAHYGVKQHRGVPCVVACSVSTRYAPANPPIVFDYVPRPCVAQQAFEAKVAASSGVPDAAVSTSAVAPSVVAAVLPTDGNISDGGSVVGCGTSGSHCLSAPAVVEVAGVATKDDDALHAVRCALPHASSADAHHRGCSVQDA